MGRVWKYYIYLKDLRAELYDPQGQFVIEDKFQSENEMEEIVDTYSEGEDLVIELLD